MKSLGYVECNGLSGAIVAADRMLKTADVELSSIQNTKGNGWVTLQVSGELSAITVAVQAVKDYLPDVYVTSVVIGRPATGLNSLGKTDLLQPNPEKKQSEKRAVAKPSSTTEEEVKKNENSDESGVQAEQSLDEKEKVEDSESSDDKQDTNSDDNEVTCNMCGDPKCPRKLGEPHKKCIHYNDLKKK
ncbi:BMC domain-containing protein [Limosilactobacillus reuteri]|uniref:BMC domain-containing protein n=1 Tax=Limosilactobacillus reuteri TaxID=1598 RepID=UPI001E4A1C34|nr:BMC domain-containing protein [Limosilactobacillus reuteri]MCC4386823.1 BMC domain-containing protein [Limosilactobacillus reuteri]MCC4392561.1 BMC domain-containing protein [Limosilactobacillus reuteri]